MKKILILFSVLLLLSACTDNSSVKDAYDGKSLSIGYLGDKPGFEVENVMFVEIQINEIDTNKDEENAKYLSEEYDALWVMPSMFDELSKDQYATFFRELNIPTAFIDSNKGHYPFVTKDLSYDTSFDLDNGSHSTLYLNYGGAENREEAWFFYLNDSDGNKKDLKKVYTEILYQIEEIS